MRPVTDKETAKAVMRWARRFRRRAYPNSVVGEYLMMAGTWSFEKEQRIKSVISSMAGKASAKSRSARRKHKRKEEEKARQFELDL
ncbi:hypothetical protein IIC45_00770 [Patescibacteria group bacterium]|nr:hypothetical protein [Patescibacteria group bacterium]